MMHRFIVVAVCVAFVCNAPLAVAAQQQKPLRWYGYIYGGSMLNEDFTNIPGHLASLDHEDSQLVAIGIGKELHHWRHYATLETEMQVAQHMGAQHHTEVNALANIRWQYFPWDPWLDTSLAWGGGLSYASKKPRMEVNELGDSSQFLFAMMVELEVTLPGEKDWSAFTRIHHRSGIFGVINDVDGGSDALVFGVKKKF